MIPGTMLFRLPEFIPAATLADSKMNALPLCLEIADYITHRVEPAWSDSKEPLAAVLKLSVDQLLQLPDTHNCTYFRVFACVFVLDVYVWIRACVWVVFCFLLCVRSSFAFIISAVCDYIFLIFVAFSFSILLFFFFFYVSPINTSYRRCIPKRKRAQRLQGSSACALPTLRQREEEGGWRAACVHTRHHADATRL